PKPLEKSFIHRRFKVDRAVVTINGFGIMPEQPLVNKPDRAGSPHPDFSSGEDYKRWRDCRPL
ncbi:hypothetical protein, partial [Pedobacter miscanthi]|uniref:hypothetical protein n=1 Tax=Pedobacter miscanthi TaxID=2259170 RepID=UPI001ABF3F6A